MNRITRLIPLLLLILFSVDNNCFGQNITLSTQEEVNNFDPNITTIDGNLFIGTSPDKSNITNIEALSGLKNLSGYLTITNTLLQDLKGLDSLKTASGISISDNDSIRYISSLKNISSVEKNIRVWGNRSLQSIDGFENICYIGQDLLIGSRCYKLENLDGLKNLSEVGNNLTIANTHNLKNIDGLRNLSRINGYLSIRENRDLTNIDGLANVSYVGGYIVVTDNDQMNTIDGLIGIKKLEDDISISNNDILLNLNGLSNTETIHGELHIYNNDNIRDLDGLKNVERIDGNLIVTLNYELDQCCAIKNLLEQQDITIGGDINISHNDNGCDNVNAIFEHECNMQLSYSLSPPCAGANNGKMNVFINSYNPPPYTYHWQNNDGSVSESGTTNEDEFCMQSLSEGSYAITVTNEYGDTATLNYANVIAIEGQVFEIISLKSTNSSLGFDNGSFEVTTKGGIAPYHIEWSGPISGMKSDISTESIRIENLVYGEYQITVRDALGNSKTIDAILLDEEVPVVDCVTALDIVVLNDVSGSVDLAEYIDSKKFFTDLLSSINIGEGQNNSRAAIIEWSDFNEQEIKIPLTGNMNTIQSYLSSSRSFSSGTDPHQAMNFGYNHLKEHGRDDSEKILILSTDGSGNQVPNSLISLADQFKSEGYHIVTIAFDEAYNNSITRETLRKIASIDALAPGAASYSQLSEDLANNIVQQYICPVEPGSTATVYFNIDGAIDIIDIQLDGNCPYPEFVDITVEVSALRELSLPSGTPITFYFNDPNQVGATPIMTWYIPCIIPAGESDVFTIRLPVSSPSQVFAVLNDHGLNNPPIQFPITDIIELAYSNNQDNIRICLDDQALIQATKSAVLSMPICDTLVYYNINVCNPTEIDAFSVQVQDVQPQGFTLIEEIFDDTGCASRVNDKYNIPAGCCFTLYLTYDASQAAIGTYNNQDVLLYGPNNQTYINFDGDTSVDEDVIITDSIDCSETIIDFTKSVNIDTICDDSFIEFTFTINNSTNLPLQGLVFNDILPQPCTWSFIPYDLQGLTVASSNIAEQQAYVIISEVQANTIARFKLDAQLNLWDDDGVINNTAELHNVPDLSSGALVSLNSNNTTTVVRSAPKITLPDTIIVNSINNSVELEAAISTPASLQWTTSGDGTFSIDTSLSATYFIGVQDSIDQAFNLFLTAVSDCNESGHSTTIILQDCDINIDLIDTSGCNNMGTPFDPSDDVYQASISVSGVALGPDSSFVISYGQLNDTLAYDSIHNITLTADNIIDSIHIWDSNITACTSAIELNQESCAIACNIASVYQSIYDCHNNSTPYDSTDDSYILEFVTESNNALGQFYTVYNDMTSPLYNYGDTVSIILHADNLIDSVLIYDSEINPCSLWIVTNENHCYETPPCELELINSTVLDCNDNGTPQDSTDDYYFLDFIISGQYTSENFSAYYNDQNMGQFNYDESNSLTLSADNTIDSILIVDNGIDSCSIWITANQDHCFQNLPCELSIYESIISECNDNGTPQDSTDDYYEIEFSILAENNAMNDNFVYEYLEETSEPISYDEVVSIILDADNMIDSILIYDTNDSECDLWISSNENHCSALTSCEISWPKVFFPNGEETLNRTFGPNNPCDATLENYTLRIYNRWGQEVFSSNDYTKEWDGSYNNAKASTAVFVWHATYKLGEDQISKKGDITLIK